MLTGVGGGDWRVLGSAALVGTLFSVAAPAAFAGCVLPSGAVAGNCAYTGAGPALTIKSTGTASYPVAVEGVTTANSSRGVYGLASGANSIGGEFEITGATANLNSIALYGLNPGGSATKAGNYGNAGRFVVNNAKNQSPAVSISTTGINSYGLKVVNSGTADDSVQYPPATDNFGGIAGYFEINSPSSIAAQAAFYAVSSGGSTSTVGRYGSAGNFQVTNPNNASSVLIATSASTSSSVTAIVGNLGIGNGNGVYGEADGSTGYGVWGHSTGGIAVVGDSSSGNSASFTGGNAGSGYCYFSGSSGWTCTSDRNLKDHFAATDLDHVLDRLDAMPVYYYQMKGSLKPTRYLGPTAQDFKAAFDLGENDVTINTANAQGVALAATKGLIHKLKADEAEIAADHAKIAAEDQEIATLKQQLAEMRTVLSRIAQATIRPRQQAMIAEPAK